MLKTKKQQKERKLKDKIGVNRGPGNERIGEQKRNRERQYIETE